MIEGAMLLLVGIGALLVSIASIFRMAWLAVAIPLLIAGVAAYGAVTLGRGRLRRSRRTGDHTLRAKRTDDRMAA